MALGPDPRGCAMHPVYTLNRGHHRTGDMSDKLRVRAGKRFYGIEHNPKHFETAVTRIRAAIEEAGHGHD